MHWRATLGGLAVLYVLCLTIGALAGLVVSGLLASSAGPAALATLVVLAVGVLVVVAVTRTRAIQWTSNPYW